MYSGRWKEIIQLSSPNLWPANSQKCLLLFYVFHEDIDSFLRSPFPPSSFLLYIFDTLDLLSKAKHEQQQQHLCDRLNREDIQAASILLLLLLSMSAKVVSIYDPENMSHLIKTDAVSCCKNIQSGKAPAIWYSLLICPPALPAAWNFFSICMYVFHSRYYLFVYIYIHGMHTVR